MNTYGKLAIVLVVVLGAGVWLSAADKDNDAKPHGPRPAARKPVRDAKKGPHVRPVVIQFEHISAESFLHVMKQLARSDDGKRAHHGLRVAVHEEANAVVLLGPGDVVGVLHGIAKGLDKPSEYHERMRQREREEREEQRERDARQRRGRMGMPRCPAGGPMMPAWGPMPRGMGLPGGGRPWAGRRGGGQFRPQGRQGELPDRRPGPPAPEMEARQRELRQLAERLEQRDRELNERAEQLERRAR